MIAFQDKLAILERCCAEKPAVNDTNNQVLKSVADSSVLQQWLGLRLVQDMNQNLSTVSISRAITICPVGKSLTSFGRSKSWVFCPPPISFLAIRNSSRDAIQLRIDQRFVSMSSPIHWRLLVLQQARRTFSCVRSKGIFHSRSSFISDTRVGDIACSMTLHTTPLSHQFYGHSRELRLLVDIL